MARIRTIKPEFWDSEKLGRLSILARLTFMGLISLSDDSGRGRGEAGYLLARLHPYAPDVDRASHSLALGELEKCGLVTLYVGLDGCSYYEIPGFKKNQRIEKPSPSKLPPPSKKNSWNVPGAFREDSGNVPGRKGREGKGEEWKGRELLAPAPQAPEIKKPLTPIQYVMRAYKVAKGIHPDDKEWDKAQFSKWSRAAQKLLSAFDGSDQKAVVYLIDLGGQWDKGGLSDWTLAAVASHAWDNKGKFQEAENGRQDSAVGNIESDRSGRSRLPTQAGEIAHEVLRRIESSAGEGSRMAGPGVDQSTSGGSLHEPFLAAEDG